MEFYGIGVSKGIAIAPVYLYRPYVPQVDEILVEAEEVAQALEDYHAAQAAAQAELEELCGQMEAAGDGDKAKIFAAHREILFDDGLCEEVEDTIHEERYHPSYAVETVYAAAARMLAKSKDKLISERSVDITDVKNRLLRCLRHEKAPSLAHLEQTVVVAAHDLLPSDTAGLDRAHVAGIVTEIGGTTSHSAIIAKSYGIPAVLGAQGILDRLEDGEPVILDAVEGRLITAPTAEETEAYLEKKEAFAREQAIVSQYLDRTAETADGRRVKIGLNIGSASEEETEKTAHVDYVGLFRTEFLYMEGDHLPTEEEQLSAYRAVLEACKEKDVIIRTLDIGGDKTLQYMELPVEQNPFLGNRALRLCLANDGLFQTQLRALLRAAVYGSLSVMFPMVASLEDIRRAREAVERARRSLAEEGLEAGEIRLGIMIEIPSVALVADAVAKEVDFVSIGTNDLCQYLTATDRLNPAVTKYYQSYHPAMFRLMGYVADQMNAAGKEISVCGELGGDPLAAPALVGLGIGKLSMNISSVAAVKKVLSEHTQAELEALAAAVKGAGSAEEAEALLKAFAK